MNGKAAETYIGNIDALLRAYLPMGVEPRCFCLRLSGREPG